MSDKLEKALADVIEKANSGIEAATDFVLSELPEVIQQALTWYMVESLIFFCVGLLMAALSIKIFKFQYGLIFKPNGELTELADDGYGLSLLGGVCIFACFVVDFIYVICMLENIFELDWLKIWIAPKLWLIEYAAKLAS